MIILFSCLLYRICKLLEW